MDLGLKDNVALVVGAARGIGLAIAQQFAAEGVAVALVDRDPRVEHAAREVATGSKAQAIGLVADATDFAGVERAVAEVLEKLGRLDHVVYAAGVGSGKYGFPFWNLKPSDWDQVWRVNVLGAVHLAHAVAPHFAREKRGTMLLIASVAGQIGSQTDPPYSAAKAAVINFAQCAARDLAPHNVRVNVISPGMVKTDLNRAVWQAWHDQQPADKRIPFDQWAAEKIARVAPLARWQTPEDVAALAVFLASERAANITGQTLNVDGGQVMHA